MLTVMNGRNGWMGALAVVLAAGLAACGGAAPEAEPEAMEEPMEETAAPMEDRSSMVPTVSFVSPADGATVSSPVQMEFIVSNVNISPVPEDAVDPRPGMVHHHVGIDTECLPAGEAIPRADPWVHFGDGSKTFETMLPAGQHTLTLQVGDDLHVTQDDLCSTITITVE